MDLALFVYSLVGELTLSLHIFSFNGLQHWMFWSAYREGICQIRREPVHGGLVTASLLSTI